METPGDTGIGRMDRFTIRSVDDLLALSDTILSDLLRYADIDLGSIDIQIPPIAITITGPRFDSTISTSIMRALCNLQPRFNQLYLLARDGQLGGYLSAEERDAIELFFHVERGSSIFNFDPSGIIKALFKKMSGFEKIVVIIIILVGVVGFRIVDQVSTYRVEQLQAQVETLRIEAESKNDQQMIELVSQAIEPMKKIIEESNAANRVISRALSRIPAKVSISGVPYTSTQLAELGKKTTEDGDCTWTTEHGTYYVTTIRLPGSDLKKPHTVDLSNENSNFEKVMLSEGAITDRQRAILLDAVTDQPVELELQVQTLANGSTGSVIITGFGPERQGLLFSDYE